MTRKSLHTAACDLASWIPTTEARELAIACWSTLLRSLHICIRCHHSTPVCPRREAWARLRQVARGIRVGMNAAIFTSMFCRSGRARLDATVGWDQILGCLNCECHAVVAVSPLHGIDLLCIFTRESGFHSVSAELPAVAADGP